MQTFDKYFPWVATGLSLAVVIIYFAKFLRWLPSINPFPSH